MLNHLFLFVKSAVKSKAISNFPSHDSLLGTPKSTNLGDYSQESKMNSIMQNPGYSHISQKILKLLDHESQMICRLVNPDWKAQMDQAYF